MTVSYPKKSHTENPNIIKLNNLMRRLQECDPEDTKAIHGVAVDTVRYLTDRMNHLLNTNDMIGRR